MPKIFQNISPLVLDLFLVFMFPVDRTISVTIRFWQQKAFEEGTSRLNSFKQ